MVRLNKVFIAGNLTRDPEVNYTPSGKAIAKLGLAMNNSYVTQSGEKRDDVVFVDVDVWGKQAENAKKYLSKGSPILVEGSLKYDTWENQQGEKKSKLKVSASSIQFLSSKGRGEGSGSEPSYGNVNESVGGGAGRSAESVAPSTTIEEDDIPF